MTTTHEYKPLRYFAITFAVTFGLWAGGAWASFNDPRLYIWLMLPGLMAPFVISTVIVMSSGDRALRREFVDRLYNLKRVDPRNVPAFVLLMPLAVIASIALSLLFGGSPEQFRLAEEFSFSTGVVPVLVILLLAASFEELGWRGYAFDSLQARLGTFRATLLFSVLWAAWHLPLLFVKDSYQYGILQESPWYALNFFVGIVPLGVIITWICMRNGKSVAWTVLFHFIVNMSQEALSMTQGTKCIETIVLAVIAAGIVLLDRQAFAAETELPALPRRYGTHVGHVGRFDCTPVLGAHRADPTSARARTGQPDAADSSLPGLRLGCAGSRHIRRTPRLTEGGKPARSVPTQLAQFPVQHRPHLAHGTVGRLIDVRCVVANDHRLPTRDPRLE
jgi:membrane protease YdiL (CAAX protease family)